MKMNCWISLHEWYWWELVISGSAGKKEDFRLSKWLLVNHFSILGVVLSWAELPESVWKNCYEIKSGPTWFEVGETILLPSAGIEIKKISTISDLGKGRIIISTSLKCHIFTMFVWLVSNFVLIAIIFQFILENILYQGGQSWRKIWANGPDVNCQFPCRNSCVA